MKVDSFSSATSWEEEEEEEEEEVLSILQKESERTQSVWPSSDPRKEKEMGAAAAAEAGAAPVLDGGNVT